jgi:hypothetical protein
MRPEDTQMASGRVEQPSLVERLRQPWPPSNSEDPLMTEAADEITRLTAEVERLGGFETANRLNAAQVKAQRARVAELEGALREIAREQSAPTATIAADRFQSIARAALTQPTPMEKTV